ncbi:MAG: 4Fe-4S ferredoxin, partial [Promethearchaeia archaeon]
MNNCNQSKVYFIGLDVEDEEDQMHLKIQRLFDAAEFNSFLKKGDLTAIKVHFGEMGNSTFIPPWYIASIVAKIREAGAKPFVTDTNTLYRGKRRNAVDHIYTAILHGFTYATIGAPVVIADGLTGKNYTEVEINQKHFKKVKIASDLVNADAVIFSSHFKGHMMAGFGGTLKNIGMGCASVQGKKEQHNVRPYLPEIEKCVGCGVCKNHCPADAIEIVEGKYTVDKDACVGCGDCIRYCPEGALAFNWESDIAEFTERLIEYAYGVWKIHQKKMGFINFVINITPECDCYNLSEIPIVKDIGILASTDPVALDKACYDLVNKQQGSQDSRMESNYNPGEDKFLGVHKETRGDIQFSYSEKLGMGTTSY